MSKLDYLKSKQDQKGSNFGMIGMGYVIPIIEELDIRIKELEAMIVEARNIMITMMIT